jgi:hypothetical protein
MTINGVGRAKRSVPAILKDNFCFGGHTRGARFARPTKYRVINFIELQIL